jgi:hypothetical protein
MPKQRIQMIGTNLPSHTPTQPDLPTDFLLAFVCSFLPFVDHIEHDGRGEFVVRLATTFGCLKDVNGVPRTDTLGRRGRGQHCIEGWESGDF